MAAVLGLIIGVVIGVFVRPDIPIALQPYLPIMVLAALDALLGAARAYFQRSFSDKVFVISFFSNVITATLLVFLGNQLGVSSQLQTAVLVVHGNRKFTNESSVRSFLFKGSCGQAQTEEGCAECEGHSRAPVFKRARNRALRVAGLQLRYPAEQHDLHI